MDRKLVLILVLLAIYIFFTRSLSEGIRLKKVELINLDRSIAKEKFILSETHRIRKMYPIEIRKIKHNRKLFFSEAISIPSAMSSIQRFIKMTARKDNVQVLSLNWGAPVENDGYVSLPISMFLKANPERIFSFIKDVFQSEKLFKFSMFSVSKYRKGEITVRAIVVGFKLAKGVNK